MIPKSRLVKPFRKALPRLTAAVAAMLALAASAHASTVVTDGGFEAAGPNTAYYTGQTIDGGAWTVTLGSVFIDSGDPYVYKGNNSLNLTGINPYVANTIAQTLATVAGVTYTISFFADADSANLFSLLENGILVSGAPTSIANNGFPGTTNSALYTAYTGSFVATSALTTLSLSDIANPPIGSFLGSVSIDDVSVQAVPTPEPGSIALVLTGLTGLAEVLRRKRLNVA